ncbi:MAG: hypothetical protein D6696_19025, partial [Acidobacteria bacterium]
MNRKTLFLPPLLLATAVALLWLVGSPAGACSITKGGKCGGSPCPAGQTCTKVSDVECKCVKNALLELAAGDNACLQAAAAVRSLARELPAAGRAAGRNCLGDCLARCRNSHLACIDRCREVEPGDPDCIDRCNEDRDRCDQRCFDKCGAPRKASGAPLDLVADEIEVPELAAAEANGGGGVIAVRIFFRVQGLGSFRANRFNTADGATTALIKPGRTVKLVAEPAPGHRFLHWLLNDQFSSAEPKHVVRASRGLTITAVFK